MNRRIAPAVVVAALATGALATMLTGTAEAAGTAAGAVQPPAATSTASTPAKARGVVVEVPRDAPSTVSLSRRFAPGTVFSVSLRENPSTGFGWSQSVPADATGPVTFLDTDYVQDPAAPGMAGVGGTRYFRYLVTSRGSTSITFLYRRPWETGVPPLQQATLTVHAR